MNDPESLPLVTAAVIGTLRQIPYYNAIVHKYQRVCDHPRQATINRKLVSSPRRDFLVPYGEEKSAQSARGCHGGM